jgi:hypothetical protein
MPLESVAYKICTELANLTQFVTFIADKRVNNHVLMGLPREVRFQAESSLSGF